MSKEPVQNIYFAEDGFSDKDRKRIVSVIRKQHGLYEMTDYEVFQTYLEAISRLANGQMFSVNIRSDHAQSLVTMVQWFKKMIKVRGVDTPDLTAVYCDELIKDLSKKE